MLPDPFHNALILTGPTGSGKTQLGIEIAQRMGAEIVSMDSMALYRGMDVGTAKPTAEERRRVPHHLIDILDPWESASVAWWLEHAAACCQQIEGRGRRVLFVGGTPLYLKALLYGLFDGPASDPELRSRLYAEAERSGCQTLHDRLAGIDPIAAGRIHPHDVRRIVRALEVWELTGSPLSSWQQQWTIRAGRLDRTTKKRGKDGQAPQDSQKTGQQPITMLPNAGQTFSLRNMAHATPGTEIPRVLWLDVPRGEIYARINERVYRMIATGLLEEVQRLRAGPRPLSTQAAQGLGYREMFAYLDGQATLTETMTRIQTRSRHLAKRQLSWFRQIPECRPASRELTFRLWGLTMN